jgi:cytochrome c
MEAIHMKKLAGILVIFVITLAGIAYSAASKDDAEAMVKSAIAYYKANGMAKAFAEINNPKGQFIKGDLYVFVYDMQGNCVAHGFSQKMIGNNLMDMKDPDGKPYVKERIELAKTKGSGWQDYKFVNPTTKKIENKTAYIEKADNLIFGCGIYKP